MSKHYKWIRVTKKDHCKVCDKPDYCTYAPEAGLALCMRVESDRPSSNSMGGWLHKTGEGYVSSYIPPAPVKKAIEDKPIDATGLWFKWLTQTTFEQVDALGVELGVDTDALKALGCAWADREWQQDETKRSWATPCWAFPMRDAVGRVIGIRLRGSDGGKWSVKGSSNGLFIPTEYAFEPDGTGTLFLTEGPTDTAAALSLGIQAIGRPSCSACDDMVVQYVVKNRIRRVVIATDNDEPDQHGVIAGLRGAKKLQSALPVLSAIWVPPVKDIREFLTSGGKKTMIDSAINDLVWVRPHAKEQAA